MPSIAAQVAEPGVFDLNAACSDFSYALAAADHAIHAGASHRVIVVGVDKMSDFLDWTDRSTCVTFGDGAGAAIVEAADVPGGIGPVIWGSNPAKSQSITFSSPGRTAYPRPSVDLGKTTSLCPPLTYATADGLARCRDHGGG